MVTIVLVDPKTGKPTAIMDGTWITSIRTGAVGGIAAKHLTRKDSRIVGMIRAGVQARTWLALNKFLMLKKLGFVQKH